MSDPDTTDPEIAALMERFEASARAHPHFGQAPVVATCSPKSKVQSPKSGGVRKYPTSNIQHPTSNGFERGCPRDTEPMEESTVHSPQSTVVGSSQAEFHAAVDTKESVQKLLKYFGEHADEWIPMVKLGEVAGVHAVHSRIVEVRAALPMDLDIDQKGILFGPTGTVHSHYRLCAKADSERLKRKAKNEEGQQSLGELK